MSGFFSPAPIQHRKMHLIYLSKRCAISSINTAFARLLVISPLEMVVHGLLYFYIIWYTFIAFVGIGVFVHCFSCCSR
jgi:hypothetical protein